ncbi:MAG: hypothetical protein Kow00123_17150 [Anaerolineales bacterium]
MVHIGRLRVVHIGRRCLVQHGASNDTPASPLWITRTGDRLTYWGLRQILRRRAERAGVPAPSPHDFRRAFALAALRNGVDLISLQRLLGHADLTVIRRYLAQTDGDLQAAHAKASPVDRML